MTAEMVRNGYQSNQFDLILIGASTGGPEALTSILSSLSESFKCPIVIIQHMPENFIPSFVKQLNRDCNLECFKAVNGHMLEAGKVLVAPGNQSLEIVSKNKGFAVSYKSCSLNTEFCPSVDTLFQSVDRAMGLKVLGMVLTGIGSDGALGAKNLKESGAEIWVQEEKECVAFGMPKAVIETGIVDRILSLDDMRSGLERL